MKTLYDARMAYLSMILFALVLLTAACGDTTPASSVNAVVDAAPAARAEAAAAESDASAPVADRNFGVSGAFALFPMMTVWAEEYSTAFPNVTFDIQGGGAGKGMTDVLAGAVDIAMVSRDLRQEEIDQGAFGVPVTIDAVVPTVNADNPYIDQIMATGLTPEKAAAIWMSQELVTWGDLLGTDAAERITVYTRSDASGAGEMWAKYMGGTAQEDLNGTAVNGDPGLAEAVRQDALGIGFNNIGFTYDLATGQQIDGLRVVPLDLNGDGQIGADEEFYGDKGDLAAAIAARVFPYPPARELYLVTNGEPDANTRALYQWILTSGQAFVQEAGYVVLPADSLSNAMELIGQ